MNAVLQLLPWSVCTNDAIPVFSTSCAVALNEAYPSVAIVLFLAAILGAAHLWLAARGLELLIGPQLVATLGETVELEGDTDVISKKRAGKGRVKLHTTVQDVTTSVVSTTLFLIYTSVMLDSQMNGSSETRLYGNSDWTVRGLRLHLGCTVYELTLYAYLGKDALSYAHHVVVIFNYCRVLRTGMMAFYACWLGLVEGTNPFLSLTFATLRLGLKDHPLLPLYTVLLIVSFVLVRVLSLPLAYWTLVEDVRSHGLKGPPYDTTSPVDMFGPDQWYFVAGKFTIGFLWFVSVYWLWKMIKGHFKMQRDLAEELRVEEGRLFGASETAKAGGGQAGDGRQRSKKVE